MKGKTGNREGSHKSTTSQFNLERPLPFSQPNALRKSVSQAKGRAGVYVSLWTHREPSLTPTYREMWSDLADANTDRSLNTIPSREKNAPFIVSFFFFSSYSWVLCEESAGFVYRERPLLYFHSWARWGRGREGEPCA